MAQQADWWKRDARGRRKPLGAVDALLLRQRHRDREADLVLKHTANLELDHHERRRLRVLQDELR